MIVDKFKVISVEWIIDYIYDLYEPYKVYGDLDELLENIPKYNYPSKHYKGQVTSCVKDGEKSFVIFNPKFDEKEKQKDFRDFEYRRAKLVELRNLQMNHSNKSLTKEDADVIENQIDIIIEEVFGGSTSQISIEQNKKPFLKEIALQYVFEQRNITKSNCNKIASNHNFKSGHKLYQYFSFYSSNANRKAKPSPYSQRKLMNKIQLFEKVIEMLSKPNRERAIDELNILKRHYENDFE